MSIESRRIPSALPRRVTACALLASGLVASGCALVPAAAHREQAAVASAGAAYREPFERRALPELPTEPAWRDVLARTLLANGELEAAYFAWAAAVHRIEAAGAYPNTPISLDFSRAFSGGGSGFDRTTLGLGFDPMENLAFPTKVYQAAKVATAEAQAAGARVVALKFELQRRVRDEWLDYALLAEQLRVQDERISTARLLATTAAARAAAGGDTPTVLRGEYALTLAENERATSASAVPQTRARLNALMVRDPGASLPLPAALEPDRPLPTEDAAILALAAEHNPDLVALGRETDMRREALALARLQYIPDFNPFVGTEGAASQMAGIIVSIPTMLREVGARIREARADLHGAVAQYRQSASDRAAAVVAALAMARDAERRAALYAGPLGRTAEAIARSATLAYASNTGSLADVVAARASVLDARLLAAEAHTAREKAVADLEALIGIDAETLTEVTR